MSKKLLVYGEYTIQTTDAGADKVNINSSQVTINGNLIVTGNSSSINSTNTTIWDNIITLNGGLSPTLAPSINAGIEVDRGTLANVQIRWNEATDTWQLTNDGTNFGTILTSGLPFVSNLDMGQYSIYSSNFGNVKFDDNVAIKNTTVAPTALVGYNTIYTQPPASGGSGVFVTNETNTNQELVTKTKAIVYALIM